MDSQPKKNRIIKKSPGEDHALNFDFLRAKGIELIQQYAGQNWTDFNLHDPGITMLEYICYGLTDVAYRTTFPITDILADKKGHINRTQNFFFPKEEVLSSGPVTVNDYRKLLIDRIAEVDNVWLEPVTSSFSSNYIKGVYNVIIQPDTSFTDQTSSAVNDAGKENLQQLIQKVKSELMKHRNIGDHYENFTVLEPRDVYLKADIIIGKAVSPEPLLAKIYEALQKVINPAVSFYTEADMLARGWAIEDIYNGPLLDKGIMTDNELRERVTVLDPFTLIKAISGLEGILSIKKLQLSFDGINYQTAPLVFDSTYFPRVKINEFTPDISLYNDNYKLYIRRKDVLIREQITKRKLIGAGVQKKQIPPLTGEYKSLQDYTSIQTLFPAIYGINEERSSSRLPAAEIAKSRQLKAYLMLFEQLLANSLSQLDGITELFSTNILAANATYHFQPLYNVPDAKYILKAFTDKNEALREQDWDDFKNDPDNGFITEVRQFIESDEQYKDRKKRAFDHMLSRFNIAVYKHPIFLYEFYYERDDHTNRTDLEVRWKAAILNNLSAFTTNRVKGDNYETIKEDEGLENGFGRKMSLLLHIKSGKRRRLGNIVDKYKGHVALNKSTAAIEEAGNEEILKPGKDELITEDTDPDSLTANLTFKRQTELLFQSAMVLKNYRIAPYPNPDSETSAVYFKHPRDRKWSILSKHNDEYAALTALKKTIRLFKVMSMESEGFYLLEHLQLKPSFESKQYGFTFVDEKNKLLIRQLHWQSFAEREQTISALKELGNSYTADNHEETVTRLKELCRFNTAWLKENKDPYRDNQPKEEAIKDLLYNLKQFDPFNGDFYPAFNYSIKHTTGQIVTEDFYNFRMTVIFPSWPARFQDASFKTLARKIFKEECPAHIKISTLWLPISRMKEFDRLYFDWLDISKKEPGSAAAYLASQQLSQFIMSGIANEDEDFDESPDEEDN